jgi:ABC-type glycerol-3-phosphate transport system substrate-binding protein
MKLHGWNALLLVVVLLVSMMSGLVPALASGDELVTLRIMGVDRTANLADEKVSLSQWASGDSKLWAKLTDDLKALGIKLELNLIPEDQYETVCHTQLAAGFDCDIINITPLDSKTRMRLAEQKRILPINEIWDKYSDGTAKEFYTNGAGKFSVGLTAMEDGNVYWLTDIQTCTYGTTIVGSDMAFHIRKDWLDKLGLPVPKTTDELFNDLVAFQENDVNGSGEKDEVISIDMKAFNTGIGQWFGFGCGLTYVDELDGFKVKSPWYSEHIKDYILFMQKLVNAGLVDTSDQKSVKLPENKIAGFFEWAMETWQEPQVKVQEGAAASYYLPILVKAIDNQEPWGILQRGNQISSRGYAVTNECKNPEAVAKLLDYMASPEFTALTEWGIEGYTYTVDGDGKKAKIKEGNSEVPLMSRLTALWTNDAIFPRYDIGKQMENEMNEMVKAGKSAGYPEEGYQAKWDFSDALYSYSSTTAHDPEADYAMPTITEMAQIEATQTDLKTYSDELLTKLILGQQSLDNWDSYMNDLKRLGLDDLIAINQARYDRAHQ